MGWAAKGLYRELLDEEFMEGSLPNDIAALADICGCPVKVMEKAWPQLKPCFEEVDGRLVNVKLEEIRTEKDRIRIKRGEAGRLGGLAKQSLANGKQLLGTCQQMPYSKAEQSKGAQDDTPKASPSSFELPSWIPGETWKDFEECRKKLRRPMTNRARRDIVAKLDRLRNNGQDVEAMLAQSIRKGWQDVFEVKDELFVVSQSDPLSGIKFANAGGTR
jgi:hypothetical protein